MARQGLRPALGALLALCGLGFPSAAAAAVTTTGINAAPPQRGTGSRCELRSFGTSSSAFRTGSELQIGPAESPISRVNSPTVK